MQKPVYNLEFPSWCPSITFFGYKFLRADNYQEQVRRLQQLTTIHSEFEIQANTGTHAITAYVEIPDHEEKAVLQWSDNGATALNDLLLLLSIFTKRDVFLSGTETIEDVEGIITADPREYSGGGILRCSIPYKKHHGESAPFGHDIGFEECLNRIYLLIRSMEWQQKYRCGYFLFLGHMAFRRQPLEASFIQCWAIWEHLFAVLTEKWLSAKQIMHISATEKISYLLVEYAFKDEISDVDRKRIASLAEIRNRLVHFGRFPNRGTVYDEAVLFTKLTEFIIAKILGLAPSNVLNTMEAMEEFLSSKR
jgi:hypothetical protein